jgi:hypothetical protein
MFSIFDKIFKSTGAIKVNNNKKATRRAGISLSLSLSHIVIWPYFILITRCKRKM